MSTSGAAGEGNHPQHSLTGQRSGECARGGGTGGFPGVCAGRSGHQSAGCHVPPPIPCADQGEEEAAPGDWCHASVGLHGLPEAAHGSSDPGGGAVASTWVPKQAIILFY